MATVPAHHPNNLPLSSSSFIGREREISEAKRLLASTRLLTLTGPGGCGKTRLAVAVADHVLKSSSFEHGAWFVDLAGLDAPILIPQVVATTLGMPEARNRPLSDALADFLLPKKLLLILDNCEHLLAACAELAQRLLEHCPDVHLLATSREPLNLPHETVWLVPSLVLPDPKQPAHFEQQAKSEAVQLFVARASAALPSFALVEENAAIVEQICRRLDGIPLAIELAAARVKLLDVAQIAARLDDSLQLLTRGTRSATVRHQTMRAALDWSYSLLSPYGRALFQRLAVFSGSFTLEAVEAVCYDPAVLHADKMLDVLTDLVDKSLVLIAGRTPGEAVRYRLLEPIRQYALDQLREEGAEADTRERHLGYFIHLAEQAEPQIKSENQLLWLKRLDKEHDNFRAALAWGAQHQNHAVAGLRLAKALHLFWQRRSYGTEGRRWLQGAIANYHDHADAQPVGSQLYLAQALVAQGWLAVHQGDYGAARGSLERGLDLARALDDAITQAHALVMLAIVSEFAGDTRNAHEQTRASIESARRSGDRWSLAYAVLYNGRVLYHTGEVAVARAVLEESEALFRKTGDQWSVAAVLETLAAITSDPQAACALYEEALAIFKSLEHREVQIIVSSNLAGLALIQDDIPRAEELFNRILAEARDLGIKATVAFCLRGLGRIRILQGALDTAESLLREGMLLDQETGHQIWFALSLAGLGRVAALRGQTVPAARVLGAIAAFLKTNSINLDADDRVELEQHDTAVRAAMTSEEFEKSFAAGRALTLEQAVQELWRLEPARGRATESAAPAPPTLRLCALGPINVQWGERTLTAWPYAKVRELLFYLISHPARTKAQIGLALWPDASPAQLRNSLSTTLYHLRRTLGSAEWIIFEDDLYRFNRALDYCYDVEVFEANLLQAKRVRSQNPARAITLLQEAIQLCQGDFVEDLLAGEWFLLRREELRRKYLDGLLLTGHLYSTQNEYAHAAECYRRALEKDEVLEEAHRELMRCYARLGERGQALRHYQTLAQLMQDELGSPPALETAALYERLKRGEEV